MAKIKALVSLTTAGCGSPRHGLAGFYEQLLKGKGIEGHWCDTQPGWWNLNFEWFEFECEVETDWRWVRPTVLSPTEWNVMHNQLFRGELLMIVHYIEEKDGEKFYIPHH